MLLYVFINLKEENALKEKLNECKREKEREFEHVFYGKYLLKFQREKEKQFKILAFNGMKPVWTKWKVAVVG